MTKRTPYRRVLLKLSGEAFSDPAVQGGIDPTIVRRVAEEVAELKESDGTELGIVVGGGNIFRGNSPSAAGMDRSSCLERQCADTSAVTHTVVWRDLRSLRPAHCRMTQLDGVQLTT